MKAEDVYMRKADLAADLRKFSENCIPAGLTHCLQRALILSAAKEIERLREALQHISDWCPATQEVSLAHQMAAEADAALAPLYKDDES